MLQLCVTLHCCKIVQVAGRNMTFESPSAFSIFLKRLINPARKADDGWKTVKCNGRFLEQVKLELARRRLGMRSDDANSGASLAVMSAWTCCTSRRYSKAFNFHGCNLDFQPMFFLGQSHFAARLRSSHRNAFDEFWQAETAD